MVYRKYHEDKNPECDGDLCITLTAYVRIDGKWTKIGYYGSDCHKFSYLDEKEEEEDRQLEQKMKEINFAMREQRKRSKEFVEKWKNNENLRL